jgi:hypothetical protein
VVILSDALYDVYVFVIITTKHSRICCKQLYHGTVVLILNLVKFNREGGATSAGSAFVVLSASPQKCPSISADPGQLREMDVRLHDVTYPMRFVSELPGYNYDLFIRNPS